MLLEAFKSEFKKQNKFIWHFAASPPPPPHTKICNCKKHLFGLETHKSKHSSIQTKISVQTRWNVVEQIWCHTYLKKHFLKLSVERTQALVSNTHPFLPSLVWPLALALGKCSNLILSIEKVNMKLLCHYSVNICICYCTWKLDDLRITV